MLLDACGMTPSRRAKARRGVEGGLARTSFGGFWGELGRGRGILGRLNPERRRGGSGIRVLGVVFEGVVAWVMGAVVRLMLLWV